MEADNVMPKCKDCDKCYQEEFSPSEDWICEETGAIVSYVLEKELDCEWFEKREDTA